MLINESIGPVVVAFSGLPGTGKSTLADLVARRIGAPSFAGDWLMGALKPAHRVLADLDRASSLAMYHSLLACLVGRQLMLGQSAVVDSVLTDTVAAQWRAEAERFDANLFLIECVCSDTDLHRSRVTGRTRGIPGWHEIDWDHVERMRAEFPQLTTTDLVVDAVNPLDHNAGLVLDLLRC